MKGWHKPLQAAGACHPPIHIFPILPPTSLSKTLHKCVFVLMSALVKSYEGIYVIRHKSKKAKAFNFILLMHCILLANHR